MTEKTYLFSPTSLSLSDEGEYRNYFSFAQRSGVPGVIPFNYMDDGLKTKVQSSVADYDVFKVTGTGTDMNISVDKGAAYFYGQLYYNDAVTPFTLSAREANPRIDMVVLEFNFSATPVTAEIKVVKGTATATPPDPSPTQTTTIHQVTLAFIYVPASSGGWPIVYDCRQWATPVLTLRASLGAGAYLTTGYIIPALYLSRGWDIVRGTIMLDATGSADIYMNVQDYASSPSSSNGVIGSGRTFSIASGVRTNITRSNFRGNANVCGWNHVVEHDQYFSMYLNTITTALGLSVVVSYYDLGGEN